MLRHHATVCALRHCEKPRSCVSLHMLQVHSGFTLGLVAVASGEGEGKREKTWFAWRLPPGPHDAAHAAHGRMSRLLATHLQPLTMQVQHMCPQPAAGPNTPPAPSGRRMEAQAAGASAACPASVPPPAPPPFCDVCIMAAGTQTRSVTLRHRRLCEALQRAPCADTVPPSADAIVTIDRALYVPSDGKVGQRAITTIFALAKHEATTGKVCCFVSDCLSAELPGPHMPTVVPPQ